MIVTSICLSDIPEDEITTSSNGKKYVNIVVDQRKEKDQYDNTHTVYMSQSKDERQAKVPKKYVGNGKEYTF
jgi:ABC-type metal ion transport system substrate-binding protein